MLFNYYMKRGFILLFISLISLINVNGQNITIAGQDISIIVLVPLILIILVLIIFATTFIMDTKTYSLKTPKIEKPAGDKILEIKTEQPKRQIIWVNYLDVIDTFVKRLEEKDPKDAFNTIIRIIREFFKERFNLEYEFTYDELQEELKKRNFENIEFIKHLIDLTYKDNQISKKDIYYLSDKFRDLIKIIDRNRLEESKLNQINKNIRFDKARKMLLNIHNKENNIDNKLNKFLNDETKKIFQHAKKSDVKKDFDDFDRDKLEQINFLIINGRKSLYKNDLDNLKEIYGDLCYLFPFLSDKSKKTAYLEILEFYEEINKKLFPELFKKN